jgi:Grx4 family monothiol glutaredoxin
MSVTDIKSEGEYTKAINDKDIAVLHFWADFAQECGTMNDVMTELSKDTSLGNVKYYKLAAEEMPELSMKHEIVAVPTLLLFRAGKAIDRIDGANAAELTKKVKSHSAAKVDSLPLAVAPVQKEDLDTKLKRLISAHKCMLFMKGRPDEPKCGFSKQTIAILEDLKAEYGTFDILTDDEVRQGLKTFSNWPTYPQLYIDGELMGGLDIIKEMVESGDLQTMLPQKQSLDDRLKALINTGPVMVFMKGDPSTPKCGFSRQLMEILDDTKLKFDTFDILTDDSVRQGLKTYSNWPTYPQVYVKGELIGGLDIIKELKEAGELVPSLKGEC